MRVFPALGFLMCVAAGWAQPVADAPVLAAQAELARIQSLVDAGVLPPASLEKARDTVADAQDVAILRRVTANGSDLSVDQADEMVAAAKRRVDRRRKAYDQAAQLVDAGAAARITLQPLAEDLEYQRKEALLAESRAQLIHELADMVTAEAAALAPIDSADSPFLASHYRKVEQAYRMHFGKPMPVSAMGQTAVHRAMGFDHTGRVDVALNPDQPEGVWLMEYLRQNHIPFIAFRGPVPGKATGAHIHIGPSSTRLASGG